MNEVVYAIRISHLEYSGLKIMDIKIGKSTNIDNTLRQYSRGNRDVELLDMWIPNPDKNLSTAERGVHEVAEKYAYDKQSEKFGFLQGAYQEFAETINKLLQNASHENLVEETTSREPETVDDYTGTTPSVIKILGETYDVDTWAATLTMAVEAILRDAVGVLVR
ncbi:GIY-YIG nuclease family protein [Halorubrum sp. 48-1-W]|uniref:GIY-YIG nuclease family protein n=1 Tax=Halorubrum sp. 48-1-W TaxID=2249761 RepID=UPI001F53FF97|nr:GIY-YIG nuclease family protein [Halorubrum sp. 48-1-W]